MTVSLLLCLGLAVAPADGSAEVPDTLPRVALAGEVETAGTFVLRAGATVADLLEAGRCSDPAPSILIVRDGLKHENVDPGVPLVTGDAVLINPSFSPTMRRVVILCEGHLPQVVRLDPADATIQKLRAKLNLSGSESIQAAPMSLRDGSIHDGAAIMLPASAANHQEVVRLRSQMTIYDARQVAAAPRPAAPAGPTTTPVVPVSDPQPASVDAPSTDAALLPTQTLDLAQPLPAIGLNGAAGPMAAAAVSEPNSAVPQQTGVAPLVQTPLVSTPPAMPGVSSAASPAAMRPAAAPQVLQTAAVGPSPSTPQTAAPQTFSAVQARPIDSAGDTATEATAELPPEPMPIAGRLGGVMFAAIMLVVCCGGLVLWSRGGEAAPSAAAASSQMFARASVEELPAAAAPITELPAAPIPPAQLQGQVVGLDRLRVDSAHPISPPHYAARAPQAAPPATAATTDAPATAAQPVAAPKFATHAAATRQPVAAASVREPISTPDAERPADLLARALQAMQREKRDA